MAIRFFNDRIIDIQPIKYQHLKMYLDGVVKDEKERDFLKKLFVKVIELFVSIKSYSIKEIKQALPLLDFAFELGEKRFEWVSPSMGSSQDQDGPGRNSEREDQNDMKKEREESIKRAEMQMTTNFYINIITIDPWHYVVYWRSFLNFASLSFFFNFQIISETEHECFGAYYEAPNSPNRQKIEEKSPFYPYLQRIFNKYNPQHQMINGISNSNEEYKEASSQGRWKIKLQNKNDLIKLMGSLTLYFSYILEQMVNKKVSSGNSSSNLSTMNNTANQ